MAFDIDLAESVRDILADHPSITERTMFGGLAFFVAGNMACGVVGPDLMVRLGEHGADDALDHPGVRPFDITGRPVKSMIYVTPNLTDITIAQWVHDGVRYAASLPPKA